MWGGGGWAVLNVQIIMLMRHMQAHNSCKNIDSQPTFWLYEYKPQCIFYELEERQKSSNLNTSAMLGRCPAPTNSRLSAGVITVLLLCMHIIQRIQNVYV